MSKPRTRTKSTATSKPRKRSNASLRARRVLFTAEALFIQSISSQGDGYSHADYYAGESLRAARIFWDHADPRSKP